jgi:positive phototaxis protein PixI
MNQKLQLDRVEILTLVEQGDPKTIASLINRYLAPKGIRARVAWKDAYLGILLEAANVPNQEKMVDFIRHGFSDLEIESVKAVRVYGRQVGQISPAWCKEIEIQKPVPSDYSILSLTEWLSQGLTQEAAEDFSIVEQDSNLDLEVCKFLRFYFNFKNTALLPLNSVKEVLNIPIADILPVPHMPECLLGIYHCRGEMLWLVDLGQQLGFAANTESLLPTLDFSLNQSQELTIFETNSKSFTLNIPNVTLSEQQTTLTAIVIQDGKRFIAMVVPKVIDIEVYDLRQIQPPSCELFSSNILRFVIGYLTRSNTPVFDVKALIEDPQLQLYEYP